MAIARIAAVLIPNFITFMVSAFVRGLSSGPVILIIPVRKHEALASVSAGRSLIACC